jgi:hypothetical protein
MLVILIAGGVYVFLKGLHAYRGLGGLGARVQKDLSAMNIGSDQSDGEERAAPAVTEPLSQTSRRYEDAHLQRLEYKRRRRNRHTQTWARWERFNTVNTPNNEGGNR